MDSTTVLIYFAAGAWMIQIVLGYLQIRSFNRMLQSMTHKGKVKIGRTQSRWKPRTVLVLVEDEDQHVVDAQVMKGISVFARPKTLDQLIGQSLPIPESLIFELDPNVQEALNVAISRQ
ncbi:transcriptional regulator GutM [Vibrio sp. V03_P4A6T147]|uniref:transcriptional regulator GutM n=1 Tax=Vibrio sp. V03_P4A6T147 TaxID=1938658 RepID=UPI000B8E5456|nr:transcriptional regulator [Vibrio sp. V03_P4A6T147]